MTKIDLVNTANGCQLEEDTLIIASIDTVRIKPGKSHENIEWLINMAYQAGVKAGVRKAQKRLRLAIGA